MKSEYAYALPRMQVCKVTEFPISLNNSDTWSHFPQLSDTITIDKPTLVGISYNVTLFMPQGDNYICTRVMIDGI